MAVTVFLDTISGATEPYDVYVCQPDGTSCFYMVRVYDTDFPYEFAVPAPYDVSPSYMIKLIDAKGYNMTGIANVSQQNI